MQTPRKHPRLCFSLRTLLLFVLLIAAAGALWWRWEPWGFAYSIQRTEEIDGVNLSPDGKLFLLTLKDSNPDAYKRRAFLEVLDVATGTRLDRIGAGDGENIVRVDGDYVYFGLVGGLGRSPALFNYLTGARIQYEQKYPRAWTHKSAYSFCSKNYALLKEPERTLLVRLPGLELVRELPPGYADIEQDDQLVLHANQQIEVHDLKAGTVEKYAGFHTTPLMVRLGKTIIEVMNESCSTRILERKTGALLYSLETDWYSISQDESRVLVDGYQDVRIFDLLTRKEIGMLGGVKNDNARLSRFLSSNVEPPYFIENDRLIWDYRQNRMYDAKSLKLLWEFNDSERVSYHSGFVILGKDRERRIATPESCASLMNLSGIRQRGVISPDHVIHFARGAERFIVYASTFPRPTGLDTHTAHVFIRRRPWQWYGAAWLPEFWLTLACAVGFIASIQKDRKLKKAREN